MAVIILYILTLYAAHISCIEIKKPNILFVVGDDIGFDDISLHGSDQILTPNIDMLGYQGLIMTQYYTDCHGTASASAILTGKYPMKLSTQGPSIGAGEDRGIPMSERLLPSYLKEMGYDTHLVGKWQLGKSRECYLPTNRGFNSFYGFTDSVDYYTYNHVEIHNGTEYYGLNFFHNLNPVKDQTGHLTNVLTERALNIIKDHDTNKPLYLHVSHAAAHIGGGMVNLQASNEDVSANKHITHSARRLYAGLVTGLDKSVGKMIGALAEKDMLNNTIIIFTCDNGAMSIGVSRNYGSNLPLRGTKGTPWEGAVRSTAVLWHSAINPKLWEGLFHVTDWLPTLVAAAGGDNIEHIDGINNWESILYDEPSKRNEVVIAVDDLQEWGAFRAGDFKIIIGNVSNTCGYYGQELSKVMNGAPNYEEALLASQTSKVFSDSLGIGLDVSYALEKRDLCNLNKQKSRRNGTANESKGFCVPNKEKGCLYNISADPEESQDLWDENLYIAQNMILRFRMLWDKLVPRREPTFDVSADPSLHDYVWYPWRENDDEFPEPIAVKPRCPMKVSTDELEYYVSLNIEALKEKFSTILENMADTFTNSIGYIMKM